MCGKVTDNVCLIDIMVLKEFKKNQAQLLLNGKDQLLAVLMIRNPKINFTYLFSVIPNILKCSIQRVG